MEKQQLEQILNYSNEDVICRFTDMMDVDEKEAQDIFTETKKFLYLSQLPGIFIPDELLIIDEMWHNFILFTKEYQAFCEINFGRFVHHQPATKAEKNAQQQQREQNATSARAEFNNKLEIIISATYDHLGEDTVIKWFNTYPSIYSTTNIKNLRKV